MIWRGAPPSSGTVQTCCGFRLAARSTDCTVNATVFPSGEICGSPIRFSSSRAFASKGRFCANSIVTEASAKTKLRRIHDDCNAVLGRGRYNRNRSCANSGTVSGRLWSGAFAIASRGAGCGFWSRLRRPRWARSWPPITC